MTANEEREDEVISSFLELLSKYFSSVEIKEKPDRLLADQRMFPNVTTDSLIKFSNESSELLIAADVMVLATGRENLVYDDAVEIFDPIAVNYDVNIFLMAMTPLFRAEVELLREVFEESILKSPKVGCFEFRPDIHMSWSPAENGTVPELNLTAGALHSVSANLAEQIYSENVDALTKKTKENGQAVRTKKSGVPYVLILDGLGQSEVKQGTHWLAGFPITFKNGILSALGDRVELISAIFYLSRDGAWSIFTNEIHEFESIVSDIGV